VKALLTILVLISSTVFALSTESVFRADSNLPKDLQPQVLVAVQKACHLTNPRLVEVSTTVEAVKVDPTITESSSDLFYTTELRSVEALNGQASLGYSIWIHSAIYASSGTGGVYSVESNSPACLK